ncbi:MAG: GNAT family N-acetyltransferase [Taibaiella sp.]|nr:GNAT family N-acetyltransferase [Taibaiella sp.]
MPEVYCKHHAFKGELLDQMLEAGWYRMMHLMFTTDVITRETGDDFDVHWLRYDVEKVPLSFYKSRNFKKLDKKYHIDYVPLHEMDIDELEELFARYRLHTKFEQATDLADTLGGYSPFFETFVTTVRKDEKLVAAGISDLGKDSIAGIKNIYDPAYASEGLGIYLLMCEIRYCLSEGLRWFYPGYIAPGYPNFDYKIYPAFTEVFITDSQSWISYNDWLAGQNNLKQ